MPDAWFTMMDRTLEDWAEWLQRAEHKSGYPTKNILAKVVAGKPSHSGGAPLTVIPSPPKIVQRISRAVDTLRRKHPETHQVIIFRYLLSVESDETQRTLDIGKSSYHKRLSPGPNVYPGVHIPHSQALTVRTG